MEGQGQPRETGRSARLRAQFNGAPARQVDVLRRFAFFAWQCPHVTVPHVTVPHVTLPRLTLPRLTLPRLTLPTNVGIFTYSRR